MAVLAKSKQKFPFMASVCYMPYKAGNIVSISPCHLAIIIYCRRFSLYARFRPQKGRYWSIIMCDLNILLINYGWLASQQHPGDQRAATVSFSKNCFLVIIPATARNLREPPGADPHAGRRSRFSGGGVGAGGQIPPATRLGRYFGEHYCILV